MNAPAGDSAVFAGTRFADPALEAAFRRDSRNAELRVTRMALVIGATNALLLAGSDLAMAGSRGVILRLLVVRLGYVILTAVMLVAAARAETTGGRDRAHVLASLATVAVDWAVLSTRAPNSYLFLSLDAVIVFTIWTVLAFPFRWQALVAAIATANTVLLLVFYRTPLPTAGSLSIASAFIVANIVGAVTSWALHRTRRKSWWKSRELEAASRAKSVFMAGVSHEVLSPLAGIVTAARELRPTLPDGHAREALAAIQSDGAALHALLTDVMALARGQVVTPELHGAPRSPRALLADLHARLAASAAAKGLRLRVEAGPSLPASVVTDGVRLQQVLSNLVGNAIRCTTSGEVKVACGRVTAADGGSWLTFTVSDTGPGIRTDDLPGLFEPFRQGKATGGKAGLGLALSRQFAEQMGGRIEVEGGEGSGATFRLVLPLVEAEAVAEPVGAQEPEPLTGRDAALVAEAWALAEAPSAARARDLADRASRMAVEKGDRDLERWADEVLARASALDAEGLARVLRRVV